MDLLLLGVESPVASLLKRQVGTQAPPELRVHSLSVHDSVGVDGGHWDVIIVDSKLQSDPRLADLVKKDRFQGLKIVLTEKDDLNSNIEYWGASVHSYLLKPVNREQFQLVWENAVEQIERGKKLSRFRGEPETRSAEVFAHQEVRGEDSYRLKSLLLEHVKMQELNQEKTNYLTRISHDLLTPLTALQGYLQLLAGCQAGPMNELQSRMVNSSLDSCDRLLRLARSLTDLGALDCNQGLLRLETGHIGECLSQSLSELCEKARAKNLVVNVDADERIPQFRFDFTRMQQVFVNLVENAIKFTPHGGSIRIRCTPHFWDRRTVREMVCGKGERREPTSRLDFNSVRVVVEDTGVGIPAEFLQNIFEDYFRVSNGNGSPSGFGLGLATARRVVLAHQGKIWAESTPGRGSSFTVLIPFLKETVQ